METITFLFAMLDLITGGSLMLRAIRFKNYGVTGLMIAFMLFKIPYTLGQESFNSSFYFWLFYDLGMLSALWHEMGKRRSTISETIK